MITEENSMTLPARLIELADRLNVECGRRVMQSNPNSADYYDPADPRRILMTEAATAIRALASRAGVPDGFALVPVVPTDAMELAFDDGYFRAYFHRDAYAAMLAAAPEPVAVALDSEESK